jgi:hypothetical protein
LVVRYPLSISASSALIGEFAKSSWKGSKGGEMLLFCTGEDSSRFFALSCYTDRSLPVNRPRNLVFPSVYSKLPVALIRLAVLSRKSSAFETLKGLVSKFYIVFECISLLLTKMESSWIEAFTPREVTRFR